MRSGDAETDSNEPIVLALSGEIDNANAAQVIARGLAALAAAAGDLVIDLSEVAFLDSTALGALITIRNTADQQGRAVIVRNPQPHIRRIFEMTGQIEAFCIGPA
jgi:anti-anti-sigma factor